MSYHYFVVCYDTEKNKFYVDLNEHYRIFDDGKSIQVKTEKGYEWVHEESSELLNDIDFQAWQNLKKLLTTYKGEIKL